MTYSVGPKGQVVIPKPLRDELGIAAGDELEFELRDGELVLRKREQVTLLGMFAGAGLLDELTAERARELERDEQRLREWSGR